MKIFVFFSYEISGKRLCHSFLFYESYPYMFITITILRNNAQLHKNRRKFSFYLFRFACINNFSFSWAFQHIADIYAFLVVFVLPLNSAVNPILYTFTTSKYRNQILVRGWNKLTSRKWRHDGSGHTGSNQGA